jgi:hypothetical protein
VTERRSKLLVGAAVWLSFLIVSLVSAPIPAVNEPHYLAMARHYWDSSWCANDLFLQSFPAHRVFYQTVGWLTLWFELATVAFIGRIVSLALLAASWASLARRLHRGAPGDVVTPVLSAWLFVGLQAIGNLSGEWLIGGFESKVIAYAFVFWAVAALLDRRPILSAMCGGIAVSFHPIIGLWHVAALLFAEIVSFKRQNWNSDQVRRWLLAGLLLCVTALPGLLPAIRMLEVGDARTAFAANFIQVHYRLKHHLDPLDFGRLNYLGYALLAALWVGAAVVLKWRQKLTLADRWWTGYVVATGLFAAAGWLVGYGPRPIQMMSGYEWRMALLKFYPFRLFDLLLPIAVSLVLPRLLPQRWVCLVAAVGLGWALVSHHVRPPANQLSPAVQADWRDVCRWVAANTPNDPVFLTPDEAEAFKWFAQRAEYVNRKDCPQDAAGIVKWNDRQRKITKWSEASFNDDQTYSLEELRKLVQLTNGVRFAIISSRERYSVAEADLLYANNSYKIVRLPDAELPSERKP